MKLQRARLCERTKIPKDLPWLENLSDAKKMKSTRHKGEENPFVGLKNQLYKCETENMELTESSWQQAQCESMCDMLPAPNLGSTNSVTFTEQRCHLPADSVQMKSHRIRSAKGPDWQGAVSERAVRMGQALETPLSK